MAEPIDAVFESQFDARGSWIRPPTAPERAVESREARDAIDECLEGLPPLQRAVFQLRQVEDLSAADTASMSLVAFYAALLRAQGDLYDHLSTLLDWRPSGNLDADLPVLQPHLPAVLRPISPVWQYPIRWASSFAAQRVSAGARAL